MNFGLSDLSAEAGDEIHVRRQAFVNGHDGAGA
jgi:hypothetical protein